MVFRKSSISQVRTAPRPPRSDLEIIRAAAIVGGGVLAPRETRRGQPKAADETRLQAPKTKRVSRKPAHKLSQSERLDVIMECCGLLGIQITREEVAGLTICARASLHLRAEKKQGMHNTIKLMNNQVSYYNKPIQSEKRRLCYARKRKERAESAQSSEDSENHPESRNNGEAEDVEDHPDDLVEDDRGDDDDDDTIDDHEEDRADK